jgi:2'-5' RNA ligase
MYSQSASPSFDRRRVANLPAKKNLRRETTESELKTAVVLVLSQFSPELTALHAEYHPAAVVCGIPLHITLLSPFVPRRQLTDGVVSTLRTLFAGQAPLSFELARIDAFPDAIYAAPEPAAELIDVIDELALAFPETPPYGGAFSETIPHATLAVPTEGSEGEKMAEELRSAAASLLPVPCEVTYASLLEEHEPERWTEKERLPFAGD